MYERFIMKLKKEFIFWILIFIPAGVAIALSSNALYALGRASGIACLSALAISFILGCRSFWLNHFLGSPIRAYKLHHQISLTMMFLLLMHIFLSALPFFKIDLTAGIDFLFDFKDLVITSGWISFLLIFLGIVFSYLKQLKHRSWIWLHRILVLSFPAISVHLWLSFNEIDLGLSLGIALWVLTIFVLILHFLFPGTLRKLRNYEIIEIDQLSSKVVELKLAPKGEGIEFKPGQYIYLSVDCKEGCNVSRESHPFTIDSAANSKEISLAIKALGDDSEKLQHIKRGHLMSVEGPYGNLLTNVKTERKQLWIAGGIGVTPFLSYLRHKKLMPTDIQDIVLLLFIKEESENVFAKDLSNIKGVKFNFFIDDSDGPLDLKKCLPIDWRLRDIVISGPSGMVAFFKKELYAMDAHNIQSEEFDF